MGSGSGVMGWVVKDRDLETNADRRRLCEHAGRVEIGRLE